VGKAVADYLMGVSLDGFNVRTLPENEYQTAVVEAELSPEQRFVADWDGEKVGATPFYQLYRASVWRTITDMQRTRQGLGI
jgi:hypothetical protein